MDMAVVYEELIKSVMDGTFGQQHWVSMSNGAIYLLGLNKAVSPSLQAELKTIENKIVTGKINVLDLPGAVDLHKFLDKTFPR
jgi:basic membrane lipoprotein Med (substrate-binding protein (PBP1-ABC) superfamily)